MTIIKPPNDPTIMALRQELRDIEEAREQRHYLGASQVGHMCERKTWYSFHKPELRPPMNDMGHLATQCGHRAEATMIEYLKLIPGLDLATEHEGHQIGFRDFNGYFRGHVDGIIRGLHGAPKAPHVWEHKDCNVKKFDKFRKLKHELGEKQTLKEWDIIYYGQAQIYMHYMEIDRHWMTVSLSGVRDIDACRTEYNKPYAEMLVDRAKRILVSEKPLGRISDKPDYYMCRWCEFAETCHATS